MHMHRNDDASQTTPNKATTPAKDVIPPTRKMLAPLQPGTSLTFAHGEYTIFLVLCLSFHEFYVIRSFYEFCVIRFIA